MLDISIGIFLPSDDRIAEYSHVRIFDVIEKLIYENQSIDQYQKQFADHINKCAIKYDKVAYINTNIQIEYITLVFQYKAVKCLNFLMTKRMLFPSYFWHVFTGEDDQKELYNVMAKHNQFIDADWLRHRSTRMENSDQKCISNVIQWMGISNILENTHILYICAKYVISIYGMEPFIANALRNPSKIIDDFIQSGLEIYPVENRERILLQHIDHALKDDDILYTVIDNLNHEDPYKLASISVYKDIHKNNDIQYVLDHL